MNEMVYKGSQKDDCIYCFKDEGMCAYKWGWGRPKWKALKGSKVKTQAQAEGNEKKEKGGVERPCLLGKKITWNLW